jgi:ketosteroid isomerase-like protein
MRKFAGLAMMLLGVAGCTGESAAPLCDFFCTVEEIVHASETHDWDAFEALVTEGDAIRLVEPYGPVRVGREAYIEALYGAFHDERPASLDYGIVERRAGTDMGYVLFDVEMRVEGQEEPWRYHQLVILALENGEWRIIHDQITAVDSDPGAFGENTEETPAEED